MDLQFTPEEKAFRTEVRNFIRDNLPKETRERMRLGYTATKPQIVEWLKILNARGGWSVPGWPKEWGGPGWTTVQRATLSEHLVSSDPSVVQRIDLLTRGMMAKGAPYLVAKQQAVAIMGGQVQAQASVLAFSKLYLLNGILLLSALPLLLLWRTGKTKGFGGDAH